jgi:hypothetical protein
MKSKISVRTGVFTTSLALMVLSRMTSLVLHYPPKLYRGFLVQHLLIPKNWRFKFNAEKSSVLRFSPLTAKTMHVVYGSSALNQSTYPKCTTTLEFFFNPNFFTLRKYERSTGIFCTRNTGTPLPWYYMAFVQQNCCSLHSIRM